VQAHAPEADLILELGADVVGAMNVSQLKAGRDLLPDDAEAATHRLADRLQRLPTRGAPRGMDAEDLGGAAM
jgi:hypothetical protein